VRASAQKELENATRLQPNLPEVQVAQAFYQDFVLHDSEHARPIFERLLTELPNDADVPGRLVTIALQQGRWDESRVYVDRAIELNPREPSLRFLAAMVRESTRDFAGALHCYDEALGVWPDNLYLNAGKAGTYQLLGDLDRAGETLKKIHPTATTDFGVSEIYYQAKLSRSYSDAISFLKRLLEQPASFDKGSCRRMLGDLQRLSGDIKNATASYIEARNEIEPLLKEQPDDADSTYEELARVYAGLENRELALEYAQRATTLTPASKDAWNGPSKEETRARIAAHFGQNDLAISTLEHLLKTPYGGSITPAWLQLDPDFDSLRGDPRFQKLVSESEPK
jgi:tetratricopeptide (TPR) repeat protein